MKTKEEIRELAYQSYSITDNVFYEHKDVYIKGFIDGYNSNQVDCHVSGDFGEKNGMDLAMSIIRKFRDKYNPSNAVMYIKDEETGEIIFYADKEESDKLLKIVSQNSR
jgi:hypothetical protein